MKSNCLEVFNCVVVTGNIISAPKAGLTNKGAYHYQFVIASPKGKFIDLNNCNYIPCIAWGDIAKKLDLNKEDWVKILGKINTFKDSTGNKFQIIIEDLEVIDIV